MSFWQYPPRSGNLILARTSSPWHSVEAVRRWSPNRPCAWAVPPRPICSCPSVDGFTTGQLIYLAAHEGVGKRGVTADQRFRKQGESLLDQMLKLGGAKSVKDIRDGCILRSFLIGQANVFLP